MVPPGGRAGSLASASVTTSLSPDPFRPARPRTKPRRALPPAIEQWFEAHAPVAAKVPEITLMFWIVKILTTAMGEATSDFYAEGSRVVGGFLEIGLFALALWLQFRTRRYVAWTYWLLAVAIAIIGTGVSDTLHLAIGIPYAGTTALWAIVLALIFWRWYRSEGTLSIHSITTTRRESYYWATIFATFALGTALGDLTGTALGFGFLASGLVFTGFIFVPLIAWKGLGLNSVAAFWIAYVDTRPLGASFADYFGRARSLSGAGVGFGPTAGVLCIAVVALVSYVAVRRNDVQRPSEEQQPTWAERPVERTGSFPVSEAEGTTGA
ncbi:MAG: hypothetical protein JWM85_1664 [Acidimicrobiaceae bacterium]|nr:hypothetical protein [Acidimicrobiaceae bacterium]